MAKFAGAAPLPSLACRLGTLRAALVSGAALSLLAGFVGPADAARGYFSPYGWYGGYRGYTYPSYAPSRRARAAPTYRDKGDPKKKRASATCRRARCRSWFPSTARR